MEALLNTLQRLDLHPVADHFTYALLIVGVVIDVIASGTTRTWLRYMALTLMILGAIAAGASYATGSMEADRVWKAMGTEARGVLHWHAMLGKYLAITFAVLAIWRILIQGVEFFAGSRAIYLIVALTASGVLLYAGHLGGQLVYGYGVGTALAGSQAAQSIPTATATPPLAESLPTVSVPTPTELANPQPSPRAAAPMEPSSPAQTPTASPTATASPV